MPLQPTRQQQDVIDAFHTSKDVLISAGAGCGKSSTLEMVARSTNKRGLLIAFNRSVADEAERKLSGTTTTARNTHRIAYGWAMGDPVGSHVVSKMQTTKRVRKDQIARSFNIRPFNYRAGKNTVSFKATEVVTIAVETLENFMKDGSTEITSRHVPYLKSLGILGDEGRIAYAALSDIAVRAARKMWDDICNPNTSNMRVTHDAYLKLWAMSAPELPYDFILLDEAQDTNPAVFSVFEGQTAQKISVGDACQQLFAWNGSVNIMEKFHAEMHVKLTQSWRFGLEIQDAANIFLEKLNADIRLQGNPRVNSILESDAAFDPLKSAATLVRTNAGAIQELIYALEAGQSSYLIGGSTSFSSLIEGAQKLQQGKVSTHPDFIGFEKWSDVQDYANNSTDGMDLKVIVNLIDKHGADALLRALEQCVSSEDKAQTVISTVHKVKGREWDQVRLASDFERPSRNRDKDGQEKGMSKEDLMLYYVAVTRAKTLLDPGPLVRYTGETGIDFLGREPEKITTSIEERLTLNLPEELRASMSSKFSNEQEAEAFILKLIGEKLSDTQVSNAQ